MSLQNKTIAFIGAGNMAEALVQGVLAAKTISSERVWVTDVRSERLAFMRERYGVHGTANNREAVSAADVIILAVKPQQMTVVLKDLKPSMSADKLIVSIAAGVTTGRIEQELGDRVRVVRVMPNTPALVGEGAAALCTGKFAADTDVRLAETILAAVGITVRVDESLMDAVTALSGSGPAYVFHVAEAMIEAGKRCGLPEDVAVQLTVQTIKGAGKLLAESGEPAGELRRKVTSPGGTTEAALGVMAQHDLKGVFREAIEAATARGRKLSQS
jgi:pyrroline-5-carboxylate reductase